MKIYILLKLAKYSLKKYIMLTVIIFLLGVIMLNLSIYLRNINTTRPARIDNVLLNPYMGYVASGKSINTYREVTLAYALVPWSLIEIEENTFDFYNLENMYNFAEWREKGVKMILRPIMDNPSSEGMQIPEWLYDKIDGDGTFYNNSYGSGFSPNYENEILIEYHRRFINALAERYNNDDFIAFIQLGSIGHWGEWHVNYGSGIQKLPYSDILESYFNHYLRAFTNKKLLIRRPMDFIYEHPVGMYNDMIGDIQSTHTWLSWINNGYISSQTGEEFRGNPDFWKLGPSGGEVFGGNVGIEHSFSNENIGETINQIQASHTSWIGPNSPVFIKYTDPMSDNIDKALKEMGYRFRVVSSQNTHRVKPGGTINLSTRWINEGVAPIYYNWPVEILIICDNGSIVHRSTTNDDIRTWLPGERITSEHEFNLPSDIDPGNYSIAVRIYENDNSNKIIKLAQMDEYRNEENEITKYKIGNLKVIQ